MRNKSSQEYFITNDIWERNQKLLLQIRRNYSPEEKDKIMKQALYSKLKNTSFDNQKAHVKIEFEHNFVLDDAGNSKSFTLCESCYVIFNDHRCKFSDYLAIIYLPPFLILTCANMFFVKVNGLGTPGKVT